MSIFIEMLEKAGERAASPIGFAAAAGMDANPPQIVLAARVMEEDLAKKPTLAGAEAAALLVGGQCPISDAAASALEGRLWGVRLSPPSTFTVDQAQALVNQGCDFIVFEGTDTEAAVLNDEELGKIVTLTADMDEEVARAIAGLSVDAVLFGPGVRGKPLTVGDLVPVQKVRQLVGQPFIVEVPDGLQQADVEAMRNLGVDGLIVDVPPLERVAEMKALIDALPRRPARRGRSDALVPGAATDAGDDEFDDL
jgi:hypothetical protein